MRLKHLSRLHVIVIAFFPFQSNICHSRVTLWTGHYPVIEVILVKLRPRISVLNDTCLYCNITDNKIV